MTLYFTLKDWEKSYEEFVSMIDAAVRDRDYNDIDVDCIEIKTDGRNETNYAILNLLKKKYRFSKIRIEFTVYI